MLFEDMISTAPSNPGVYKMYDSDGGLLYVGKAKNLKRRLRQYVDISRLEYHKILMMRQARCVEWTIAPTEQAALIMEQHFIKTEKPKYNIILKDDKMYPFLALSNDPFPRLFRFRGKIKQRRDVFGPFPFVSDLDDTIKLVQKVCRIRTCANSYFNARKKPCLMYQIGLCVAPCHIENQTKKSGMALDYKGRVTLARRILRGHIRSVVSDLSGKMKAASARHDFENAARYRGQILALQSTAKTAKINGRGIRK
ncbi:MAG: GIY-YIG nuclease family protein [Rickettsiales bacterium]|jgi:excinuclease ABC subunit C|nr:GIY-YIG nuclease family protein [Rickettsiales bacterium]